MSVRLTTIVLVIVPVKGNDFILLVTHPISKNWRQTKLRSIWLLSLPTEHNKHARHPPFFILLQWKGHGTVDLTNDPDKNYSIFYCSAATALSPRWSSYVFRWRINQPMQSRFISILKGSFLWVKTFQPITTDVNKDNKSFQFPNVLHIGLLWYLDSEEILLRGK